MTALSSHISMAAVYPLVYPSIPYLVISKRKGPGSRGWRQYLALVLMDYSGTTQGFTLTLFKLIA